MPERERALEGKRVLITRAPEQSLAMAQELARHGAEAVFLPTVAYAPVEDGRDLDAAIAELARFDWLIFTSQNAARFFLERCRALGVDAARDSSGRLGVACVGPATAEAAQAAGVEVKHVASSFRGAALAEELGERVAGRRVLLPVSDRAPEDFAEALRSRGADVTRVAAYRTLSCDADHARVFAQIERGGIHVLTFASPSAFQGFLDRWRAESSGEVPRGVWVAAIGPTTARTIAEAGWPCHIVAAESTAGGMVRAIARFAEQEGVRGVKSP
jgi:uroporphyrinogen-III synthase